MPARAFIAGLASSVLSPVERAFLRDADPWGIILFKRNIETPKQVCRLTASIREALARDAPILVDQEGGRVQRLGPPHWPLYPAGAVYGELYEEDAARGRRAAYLGACLIAADLIAVGIDVDCLPIADLSVRGADGVIGNRAYGESAVAVAAIARSVAEGLLERGVLPVLKHIPGHGRARADSHFELPVVHADRATLMATDFAAFAPLFDLPLGMTAHVVYTAIDPLAPATTSVTVVRDLIRGSLNFHGLLMTDDISMGALSGSLAERSQAAIAAGCDVILHCSGKLEEMQQVAAAVPPIAGEVDARARGALARRRQIPNGGDLSELRAEWAHLLDRTRVSRGAIS
jgi:beta-N-acetylhexosaminidase